MASIGDHNRCTHEGSRKMRVARRKLCVAHGDAKWKAVISLGLVVGFCVVSMGVVECARFQAVTTM